MALTVSARSRFTGPSTPNLIKAAALFAAVGIATSITEYADLGKWLAVAGVLLSIAGLHRFGRMGPDDAIVFELARPRKKKRPRKSAATPDRDPEPSPGAEPGSTDSEAER